MLQLIVSINIVPVNNSYTSGGKLLHRQLFLGQCVALVVVSSHPQVVMYPLFSMADFVKDLFLHWTEDKPL